MFIKIMGALLAVVAVGAFFVCLWIEYGPRKDEEEKSNEVVNEKER